MSMYEYASVCMNMCAWACTVCVCTSMYDINNCDDNKKGREILKHIDQLQKLKHLNLEKNQLEEIPKGLVKLQNLEYLNMCH